MEDMSAYISAMGQLAQTKKPKVMAPGGVQGSTPGPSKIRSDNGVTDSAFIQQIIQAAQAMNQEQMGMQSQSGMQPPAPLPTGQPPSQPAPGQPATPQDGMGGLAQMFAQLGGNR